jgi:YHS domain-containing protein
VTSAARINKGKKAQDSTRVERESGGSGKPGAPVAITDCSTATESGVPPPTGVCCDPGTFGSRWFCAVTKELAMSDVNSLVDRIEGAFTSVKEKVKQEQQQLLRDHQARQQRLKEYEKAQAKVVEVAKPRLEALAKKAGERARVTPLVSQTLRKATFEFRSAQALITLSFSISPDYPVENVVVEQDLSVVPQLWTIDAHSEFRTPVGAVDTDGLTKWLDDRIVGFVELYIRIHEGELYDKAEYVEDPVAGVKFPKFAAGATLDHGGQTYYFIDENTKTEYARKNRLAAG